VMIPVTVQATRIIAEESDPVRRTVVPWSATWYHDVHFYTTISIYHLKSYGIK